MELAEVVIELGFKDEREFHRMVASYDISSEERMEKFRSWQLNDGTRNGLQTLIEESKGE